MDESTNETIIINNLLCFIASKHKLYSADHLIKQIQDHYSDDIIKDGCETLYEAISGQLSEDIINPQKGKRTIEALIVYMRTTPKNERPIFVCKDLDDLPPHGKRKKTIEWRRLKEEYFLMKNKVTEITNIIHHLKTQLEDLAGDHSGDGVLKDSFVYMDEDLLYPGIKLKVEDSDEEDLSDEEEEDMANHMQASVKVEKQCENEDLEELESKDFPYLKKGNLERSVFICPFCKFNSECRKTLRRHIEFHSESNPQSTVDIEDVSRAIKSEGDDHQCLLCLEEFSDRNLLEDHMTVCPTMSFNQCNPKEGSEKYVCSVCSVIFSSKSSLMNHKGYHDKARSFQCSICDYRFFTQENLEVHYKVHTEGIYKCPYCEYGNVYKKRVVNHVHCHTGFKPFKCTICTYRTSSKYAIDRHILAHNEERNFHCSECSASFKTQDKLSSHKRLHIKGKPYKCPQCGKAFKLPTAMRNHYKTHSNDKPHACPLCPYRARTAGVLRIHINIHSAEKPFKCNLCDFKANQKSYLSWHMKAYHPQS